MVLGHCGCPQGAAFWQDSPQLPEDASTPAVGVGHLQIFSCPGRAQVCARLSGQDLGSQILPGHGRKMAIHSPGGSEQQKAEGIRMCSVSVLTEERSTIASPDNLPNSCSCQQPGGTWPGVWSCMLPTAPVRGQGWGCTAREFLGQVSGARALWGGATCRWQVSAGTAQMALPGGQGCPG